MIYVIHGNKITFIVIVIDCTKDLDQSHANEYRIASTYIDLWLK